jgi:nitric oxide reductase NorD protein
MEEQVGALWHRAITRLSERRHPFAAVTLEEVAVPIGIFFRALGGDGGLQVEAAEASAHGARRGFLQRLAGLDDKVELAWRDERSLRLPARIDLFPERALNRDLYIWLAALAAQQTGPTRDWLVESQDQARRTLSRFPGLRPRYRRLLDAHLDLRPDPRALPADERAREEAIRLALEDPGSVERLPTARRPPYPVVLWLHPDPELPAGAWSDPSGGESQDIDRDAAVESLGERRRRRAERVAMPEKDQGLITIRMENILTWGEHVQVDRGTDEEDDLERARTAAADLDRISVARDRKASGARLKFDLDLPAESEDDLVLSEGILLPEWDWRQGAHCARISVAWSRSSPRTPHPARCPSTCAARPIGCVISSRPSPRRGSGSAASPTDRRSTWTPICVSPRIAMPAPPAGTHGDGLYRDMRKGARDLVCLLLSDLSLSTDTWVDDRARVIDVIRDSLFLFAESLAATGDRFGLLGFSSRRRDPVRIHSLKDFDEPHGAGVRGRIAAIKPGYYTRMGAAIRYSTRLLAAQPGGRRLLLILSDGKPNDLDRYEGRYGIEDTRRAVQEARALGLTCFCVTIDERGNDYLPHLFGTGGYVVIRRPPSFRHSSRFCMPG